jgi:hypothetical protein
MPYLNLDLRYFDHIKTVRLVGLLGKGAAELPLRLWCYCGTHHAKDGNLAGYSAQEIESIVGWWGTPGAFVDAMVNVGLLDKTEKGYKVHDWEEEQGHLISFHERAKAGAKERWDRYREQHATSIATSNAQAPPQAMLHTIPNHTKPTQKALALFERFWEAYPKKRSKGQAEKAWKKLAMSEGLFERIMAAIQKARASPDWQKDHGQYIPYPATWLNAKGWEDDVGGVQKPKYRSLTDVL